MRTIEKRHLFTATIHLVRIFIEIGSCRHFIETARNIEKVQFENLLKII